MTTERNTKTVELVSALSQLTEDGAGEAAIKTIQLIIDGLNEEDLDRSSCTQALVDEGILDKLHSLLQVPDLTKKTKAAELVAELAKVESVRLPCVQHDLVQPLVNLLKETNIDTSIQACRALGNICFDNDEGRTTVDKCGGIEHLVLVLKQQLGQSEQNADRLRMVACGCLLNLANNHESTQEKVVTAGAVELMKQCLHQHSNEEGCCQMALMTLGCLSDNEKGSVEIEKCRVAPIVAGLLDTETGKELQDVILDLLGTLSESNAIKTQLAECGVCTKLVDIVKKNTGSDDEDCDNLQKLASDLVVLLLTGDHSMELLYQGGDSPVYREILAWLNSSSEQLQVSGALAVGNFARNDNHCMTLVKDGVTDHLLTLLKNVPEDVSSVTLQHAAFSALRNLAIPAANKSVMLESGILQAVLPYAKTDMAPVQFKLLGLLRMVIDNQESAAVELGTNSAFLTKLVSWCSVEEHAGVKGEANRLLAWLVKHSRSSEVMKAIIAAKGTTHLVAMTTSEHAVMQNEALVALTLMASTILDDVSEEWKNEKLIPTLHKILSDPDTLPEILTNVLVLTSLLAPSSTLMSIVKQEKLQDVVKSLTKHEEDMVKMKAKETLGALTKR